MTARGLALSQGDVRKFPALETNTQTHLPCGKGVRGTVRAAGRQRGAALKELGLNETLKDRRGRGIFSGGDRGGKWHDVHKK